MKNFLEKLRRWLLIKLAGGQPVALNLNLTRALYLDACTNSGLFVNVRVKSAHVPSIIIGKDET